jgi:cytoskeletal protein CcmA (bactofilin family)
MFSRASPVPERLENLEGAESRRALGAAVQASPGSTATLRNDRSMSLIGADLAVSGDVISKGELRVDGEIEGDIKGVRLVIGEHARVTGNVAAEDVVLHGHVLGSVRGLRVSLQSTSHVEGDVYHQALIMEPGAFFEGKSIRAADPLGTPLEGNVASETFSPMGLADRLS